MLQFIINYKSENEMKILTLILILGIFFYFIPFLIAIYGFAENFSEETMSVLKAFANYTILLFVCMLALGFIPVINFFAVLIAPVLWIINLVIMIKAIIAAQKGMPISIPVIIKIL